MSSPASEARLEPFRLRGANFNLLVLRLLDPRVEVIGVVVETGCRYLAPVSFPDLITAGLRVARIGRTSIRYEIGIFRNEEDEASAEGHFIHVYVARAEQGRSVPLPARLREAATRLLLPGG